MVVAVSMRLLHATAQRRVARSAAARPIALSTRKLYSEGSPCFATRRFASNAGSSSVDELLKRDFRRWLGKEARLLAVMVVVGVTGVHFYQNRESAPARQIATLLDKARENAQKEDRVAALQNCLNAYAINKSTNAQDRHLFEMAFLVAAQFETLRNVSQATKYYHEALGSVPYIRDAAVRDMSRVVVLDRIAQCYQDQGHQRAAENYYRQAIETYDRRHSDRRAPPSAMDEQIERNIAAVLFNYGQQLMHLQKWDEAKQVLRRAQSAARAADVSSDDRDRIDHLMAMLQLASVDKSQAEQEDEDFV